MIIAGGVAEVTGSHNIDRVVSKLNSIGLEIDSIDGKKVLFQIERKTIDAVSTVVDSLRKEKDISKVHVTYYSIETPRRTQEI
jgi:hypothetical protein